MNICYKSTSVFSCRRVLNIYCNPERRSFGLRPEHPCHPERSEGSPHWPSVFLTAPRLLPAPTWTTPRSALPVRHVVTLKKDPSGCALRMTQSGDRPSKNENRRSRKNGRAGFITRYYPAGGKHELISALLPRHPLPEDR